MSSFGLISLSEDEALFSFFELIVWVHCPFFFWFLVPLHIAS